MLLTYAGIGARLTPPNVLEDMSRIAEWMARTGWHLSTGGARGADSAFAAGAPAGQHTIWLPWQGYNGLQGPDCRVPDGELRSRCMDIAERAHPAWDRCSPGVRALHARNVAILGVATERPVDAVVCWSEGGKIAGGTGLGIVIAEAHDIPVFNLGVMAPKEACEHLRDLRRALADRSPEQDEPSAADEGAQP